ncbi:hypothetical protein HDU76_004978 [Blyttiomyces sp. JEL0837]|nr:hypothetical protein HDU76_004978 [Blyttiomyces sp. JEL0837]
MSITETCYDPDIIKPPLEAFLHLLKTRPDAGFVRFMDHDPSDFLTVKQTAGLIARIAKWLTNNYPFPIVGLNMGRERYLIPMIFGSWLAGKTAAIFSLSWTHETKKAIMERLGVFMTIHCKYVPTGAAYPSTPVDEILSLVGEEEMFPQKIVANPRICWIMHTSGTTGVPKSVVIPTRAVIEELHNTLPVYYPSMHDSDIPMTSAPTFLASHALMSRVPVVRACYVFPSPTFDEMATLGSADAAARLILSGLETASRRVDFTPTLMRCVHSLAYAKFGTEPSWGHIELVRILGEVVSARDFKLMRSMFPSAKLLSVWGMTTWYLLFIFAPCKLGILLGAAHF